MRMRQFRDTAWNLRQRATNAGHGLTGVDLTAPFHELQALFRPHWAVALKWAAFAREPLELYPAQVADWATAFRALKAQLTEIKQVIKALTSQDPTTVVTGMTGASLAQTLQALITVVRWQEQAIEELRQIMSTYATRVDTGKDEVIAGQQRLAKAAGHLRRVHANVWELLHPQSAYIEFRRCVNDIKSCYDEAVDATTAIVVACDDLASIRLQDINDAIGKLDVWGQLPRGISPLDAVVLMGTTWGDDTDPDAKVLSDSQWTAFRRRWAALTPQQQADLAAAMASLDDPIAKALLAKALAAGEPFEVVIAFAGVLRGRPHDELAEMAGYRRPAAGSNDKFYPYTQQDNEQGCGADTIIQMAMHNDPLVALWVVRGLTVSGYVPPFLAHLDLRTREQHPDATTRFQALLLAVQDRSDSLLGGHPWPRALGISPGGVADALAGAGYPCHVYWNPDAPLTYKGVGVGVGDIPGMGQIVKEQDLRASLNQAATLASQGTPVPLLVGGTNGDAQYPGHYISITGFDYNPTTNQRIFTIFDPWTGGTFQISEASMLDSSAKPAFANWSTIYAVYLP